MDHTFVTERVEEEEFYALELEGKNVIVHKMTCERFIAETGDGSNTEGWIFPFESYREAYEHGSSLEGYSLPKVCGICKPWIKHQFVTVSSTLSISNSNLETVMKLIEYWFIALSYTPDEKRPDLIKGVVYEGHEYGTVYAEIRLKQVDTDVLLEIKYWGNYYEFKKKIKETTEGLEKYLNDSLNFSRERAATFEDAFSNLVNPRPLLAEARKKKEVNPLSETRSLWIINFSTALILVYVASFFLMDLSVLNDNPVELLLIFGAAYKYIYSRYISERRGRDPLVYLLLMLCGGIFSGLISAPLNLMLSRATTIPVHFVAPLVEETVKALGLYVLLTHPWTSREFNSTMDGIVYGFTIGLGFYLSESYVYFLHRDIATLIIRILLYGGHGVYVAIIGLWMGVNRHYRGYNKPSDIFPGLTVAIPLHFLWNWLYHESSFGIRVATFLYSLFLWMYLAKMITEAKSDEEFSGEDHVVFSPIDAEGSRRHSRTALVFTCILLLGAFGTYNRGYNLLEASYSRDWEKMKFMGFSFQYPERLWSETQGFNESIEATEEYGQINFVNHEGKAKENLKVQYVAEEEAKEGRDTYDEALPGDYVTLGEERETGIGGHDCFYREFTMFMDDEEFNGVACGWLCEETGRVFFIKYYTVRDDSYETWRRTVDSFVCHLTYYPV